jgi:hypothetical protein
VSTILISPAVLVGKMKDTIGCDLNSQLQYGMILVVCYMRSSVLPHGMPAWDLVARPSRLETGHGVEFYHESLARCW